MVLLDGDRYFVVDVGSTNGTTLNGELLIIHRRKLLRTGDLIDVAGFRIEFGAGVPMISHHSQDRTLATARQLTHQLMAAQDQSLSRPMLVVANGPQEGERFELDDPPGSMFIGRETDCEIVLVDSEASRRHVAIDITAEGVVARDLSSLNPLLVNGKETVRQRLRDRDELLVGSTTLVFDDPVEAYLRDLAQWPEEECAEPMEIADQQDSFDSSMDTSEPSPSADEETRDSEPEEVDSKGRASDVTLTDVASEPEDPTNDDGVTQEARNGVSEGGERSSVSPVESAVARPSTAGPGSESKTSSAGSEIAILLVGALALVACVIALIWIFR